MTTEATRKGTERGEKEDKLKALKELREFVVEIAEACEDTVYAQQKWLVAERGLKMLVKKIDALLATEGPEAMTTEGAKP